MRSTRYMTCAIALATTLSMPAFAQGTGSGTSSATGSTGTSANTTSLRDNDRGFDWGWLGLIGLAGLMGLRKQPDVHRSDATRTSMPR